MTTHARISKMLGRPPTYFQAVMSDAPTLYWRLNETSGTSIADSSGNARTGTYTALTSGPGLLTTDSDLAAVNPLGTVASAAWMDTSFVTAEIIIKPTALVSVYYIFGRDFNATNGGAAGAAAWRLDIASSKIRWIILTAGAPTVYQTCTGATTLATDTIYHVVGTFDGTNSNLYLNGALDGSIPVSGTMKLPTTGIYIGNANVGATNFPGTMDEAAVYGTALSPTQVATHAARR